MKPRIVIYCCANSTAAPEDQIEKIEAEAGVSIRISRLPCSGRTDVLYVVRAIEQGEDFAMVIGCPEGRCQYLEGNLRARKRVGYINRLLGEAGLGADRVVMYNLDPADAGQFGAALREAAAKAKAIGPWKAR
jgi:coenzyme F420-reducing hydrogenase delta subunit